MPGQMSELGMLPVVAGVAQALAPALAPSPLPLPRASVAGIDEAADAQVGQGSVPKLACVLWSLGVPMNIRRASQPNIIQHANGH